MKNIPADIVVKFYKDFYVNSVEYVKQKLPVTDPFLKHTAIAGVSFRKKFTYSSV